MVYADQGEWDEALACYNKAVDLRLNDPNDGYGLNYYTDLLNEAKNKAGKA